MRSLHHKRLISALLALVLVCSMIPVMAVNTQATAYTGIMHQTDSQWQTVYFNGGSLSGTGCGIFSFINAVGYLTGYQLDVVEVADWAHRNGMYNVYGADGTYRTSFYPAASRRYGETYGFTIDCSSDGSGYWSGAYSTLLKNHLAGGGTAVIHVYNHFMALVGYDPASNKFHLYDCAPASHRNTTTNGGDMWVTEAFLSSGYTDMDWFCLLSLTAKDEEKPVISNVKYSNVSAAGYTVTCTVTDNQSIKRVAFPTWTLKNGQDDLAADFMNTQQGTQNGNTFTFTVKASAHNNEGGQYVTHIYAEDRSGNVTTYHLNPVEVRNDTQGPVISDVQYSKVSASGYTVTCTVTDDWGVSSVAFPTWTVANGQDDLPAQFLTTQLGTKNGNRYTFRVNASDHNNESGYYTTHIYATDCAGNRVSLALKAVQVMNDTEAPVISDAVVSDITADGYTITCKVTDNWGINSVAFPTWSVANGQDDLAQDFFNTQRGTQNGDYYTFRVKASDHNNEQGAYATHIYATDCAGNRTCLELNGVMVEDPVKTTVTAKSFSLSFEDEVLVNFYYAVSDMTEVAEQGMLVFNSKPAAADITKADNVYTGSTYVTSKGWYMNTTDGIAAKRMGDTRYYAAYVKLKNGTYVYSDVYDYSPKKYAMNMLAKSDTSEKQKDLCVAMLNYGAAAQQYFNYNASDLVNSGLTAAQKNRVIGYSKSLFVGAVANSKSSSFGTASGFVTKAASVSFESAFSINFYMTPEKAVAGEMVLYVWSPEVYAAAGSLTVANATAVTMTMGDDGRYFAPITGIAAKALDKTYYVAAVYTDTSGNLRSTGIIAYSLSKYCMGKAVAGNAMEALAAATAMYGYYAAQYFG